MKHRELNRLLASLAVVAALLGSPSAGMAASTLWYNGDFDGRDALVNATNLVSTLNGGTFYRQFVYDNFIVPAGQTWTISSVFANIEETDFTPVSTSATWQILKGVSAGNGGTTVASGDGAASMIATGGPVANPNALAYSLTETITPVVLTAGTYWLTVAPDIHADSNGNFFFASAAYIQTTSGANAVGMPPGNDGNSFINTVGLPPALSYNFTPTSSIEGPGNWDYSMGVSGTAVVVPEPAALSLAVIGLCVCGLSVAGRRLIARAASPSTPEL
jgi:hypothetical protein